MSSSLCLIIISSLSYARTASVVSACVGACVSTSGIAVVGSGTLHAQCVVVVGFRVGFVERVYIA